MSNHKFTSDMPSSSLVNGNKTANVYDYDSQAQLLNQGNSMLSSGNVPYGYNLFSYFKNERPTNHPSEYFHNGFLTTDNGKSTSSFQGNPNALLGNPENSRNMFLNSNSKSSSHDMIMETGNPIKEFDESNAFLSSHPSGILGNSESSHGVVPNNLANSTFPFVQENSRNVAESFNPILGNPSTVTGSGFNFPAVSGAYRIGNRVNVSVNPGHYVQITPPTFASGSFSNNATGNSKFRPLSGTEIEGTGSRGPAQEQETLRFGNANPSFAGRLGTNLRATPPSISIRGRDAGIRQSRREDEPMSCQPTLMDAVMKKLNEKESFRKKREIPMPTISKPAPPAPKRRKSVRQNRAPQVNTNDEDFEDEDVLILTRAQFESSTGASKGKNVQDQNGRVANNSKRGIDYGAMANNCLRPVKVEPDLFGAHNLPSLSYIQNQGPSNLLHHEVMHGTGKSSNALFSGTFQPWDKHPNYGNVTSNPYPVGDNLTFGNNSNFRFKNNGLENYDLGNTSNILRHINVPSDQGKGKTPIIESTNVAFGENLNAGENKPVYGGISNQEFEEMLKGDEELTVFSDQDSFGLDWSSYHQIMQSPEDFWNF